MTEMYEEIEEAEREELLSKEPMLSWFTYAHLPKHFQAVSYGFRALAEDIIVNVVQGPERTVALRKLLESKDAAVRAKLRPNC